jgi:hypothetical protein
VWGLASGGGPEDDDEDSGYAGGCTYSVLDLDVSSVYIISAMESESVFKVFSTKVTADGLLARSRGNGDGL